MDTKTAVAQGDDLMTAEEVAAKFRVPIKTLYEWNSAGTGPDYYKLGRQALYKRSDVDAFLEQRKVVR